MFLKVKVTAFTVQAWITSMIHFSLKAITALYQWNYVYSYYNYSDTCLTNNMGSKINIVTTCYYLVIDSIRDAQTYINMHIHTHWLTKKDSFKKLVIIQWWPVHAPGLNCGYFVAETV